MGWIKINDRFEYEPESNYAYGPNRNESYEVTPAMRRAAWRTEQGSARKHLLNLVYRLVSTAMGLNDRVGQLRQGQR